MGLDQYLSIKKYLSPYNNQEEYEEVKERYKEMGPESAEISLRVGYWRKANAIHGWFVKNFVDGNMEEWHGENLLVSRDQLRELRTACQSLVDCKDNIESKEFIAVVGKLLPPTEGFFFGDQEIDEYYISTLEHTIEVIDKVLQLPESWDIYYGASW